MKLAVSCLLAVVAVASARPQLQVAPLVTLLRSEHIRNDDGGYRHGFESDDGVLIDESAAPKTVVNADGDQVTILARTGTYSFVGPDAITYTVDWVADELGFRATGVHLPVAPEPLPLV